MSIHPRPVAGDAEELGSWPAGFRGSMSVTTLTFTLAGSELELVELA